MSDVNSLMDEIKDQADVVRKLKASKADKDQVYYTTLIEKLNQFYRLLGA